ncbi:MAG: PIN/TRAM domain-containing protein [Clostridia bacterium]|nr:MAG: PIN/TRAM domain-containing protein [Clostridia bacterium]
MVYRVIRYLISIAVGAIGLGIMFFVTQSFLTGPWQVRWALVGLAALASALVGYSIAPRLVAAVVSLTRWSEGRLHRMPPQELIGGAVGLITGLIIANLFSPSLRNLPVVGAYLPLVANVFLAYLGWSVGKKEEILGVITALPRLAGKDKGGHQLGAGAGRRANILDTSVIIDGRIADICHTGFLEGPMIIPGFVLEELRHIADSSDLLKRNRGRRGLDILNRLRQEPDLAVEVMEHDYEDLNEVDSKLVRLAQEIRGQIITNDFNLNKVAVLQGVKVLNINDLANAVKPVVLPGEEMPVQIIKDGKETGQGVGYLEDGTMIVVEGGRKYIGQTIVVVVTSVLQTSAGRMIFGRPRVVSKKQVASAVGEVSTTAW